jgi:hypothetical protein
MNYDRRSVGQYVLVSSPIWGSRPDINCYLIVTVFFSMSGAPSDERSGLSFVLVTWTALVQFIKFAAGPRQHSIYLSVFITPEEPTLGYWLLQLAYIAWPAHCWVTWCLPRARPPYCLRHVRHIVYVTLLLPGCHSNCRTQMPYCLQHARHNILEIKTILVLTGISFI